MVTPSAAGWSWCWRATWRSPSVTPASPCRSRASAWPPRRPAPPGAADPAQAGDGDRPHRAPPERRGSARLRPAQRRGRRNAELAAEVARWSDALLAAAPLALRATKQMMLAGARLRLRRSRLRRRLPRLRGDAGQRRRPRGHAGVHREARPRLARPLTRLRVLPRRRDYADSPARSTSSTATPKPSRIADDACALRSNTPRSTYVPPARVSTVIVSVPGSTIQYSGMPASA